jgi:prepilin-type N-terminal cleavage/methylation domain-containing protein
MQTCQFPGRARTAPTPSGGAAFTLIEVLVATLLIGIAFVSLYAGVSSALVQVQLAREDLRATQVLLEKSELLRL